MTTRFDLCVSPAPGKGLGRFAAQKLPANTLILQFIHGKKEKICEYRHRRCVPKDAVIFKDDKFVYYDDSFHSMRQVPIWYRLNHSFDATLMPRACGSTIKVYSRCVIEIGTELTFNYTEPDPAWV